MNADNLIILNGRLTRDVELMKSTNDKLIAKFTVAVNRLYKNANGEREADFHNCVAFGNTAEAINTYFSKGSMIGIVGESQDNNYEKDGQKIYTKQVKVDSFGFRESKGSQAPQAQEPKKDFFADFNQGNTSDVLSGLDISDDELPF